MFVSTAVRTPFRVLRTSKKFNKYLGVIISHLHQSNTRLNRDYNNDIFESTQLQKYLNFKSNQNLRSEEFNEIAALLERKRNLEKDLLNLKNLSSEGDIELKKLIETEKQEYIDNIEQVKSDILECISLEDEDDRRNVEVQIFSGIGGDEAKLFRNELFQMYINYAAYKKWECFEDLSGGYLVISGDFVYGHLRHEGGVHRVQRIPLTEKQDRVHTSTCSVVVLPQPKPHEVVIKDKDLIVERMRSSGAGGQRVNKSESCIRIKHIPTGVVIENQTSRFQYENHKLALERLRSKLFNMEQNKIKAERKSLIKGQAGTNDYADKIRTYNFPQNRITDHRLNYSMHNMKSFLSGTKDLDILITKLREFQKKRNLLDQIENTLQSTEYKNFEKHQIS